MEQGSLESAKKFSFTTKDREVWHLISKSYLKFSIKIRKQEATIPPAQPQPAAPNPPAGGEEDDQPANPAPAQAGSCY